MTTSGTVARTVIDVASVIEHAFRRCRVLPSAQTPETIQIAKHNLYFLMLDVGNRGLNLWAVEKSLVGLIQFQAAYTMPTGTLGVLNVIYSQPTCATGIFTQTSTNGTLVISDSVSAKRVGFTLGSSYTGSILIEGSVDAITYKTLVTTPNSIFSKDVYQWVDLPVSELLQSVRVSSGDTPIMPITVTDIQVATSVYDLPCTPWNRDTYSALNNKFQVGRPSTNYFFEKKLTPVVTLWPIPNNSLDHMTLYLHRQAQDVGTLTQQIEIPQRWLDGLIWMLAARLCFELPSVDLALIKMISEMADKQELEAELSETDGLPIYLQPNIACYSR